MDVEVAIGKAYLAGVEQDGTLNPKSAKARVALISVFAHVKNPYRFLMLLRKAGHADIAAGIVSELGPIDAPTRKTRPEQPEFDFSYADEDI